MLQHALLLVVSAVPLAAMLTALFAAVWLHEGQRQGAEAPAPLSRRR